jgi:hypothetical protein
MRLQFLEKAILYKNTPPEALETFETIELSVREHLLETVTSELGNFFFNQQEVRVRLSLGLNKLVRELKLLAHSGIKKMYLKC